LTLGQAMTIGAVSNIAGQVAGNIAGVQKGFNFRSLAVAVASAGIGYGLNNIGGAGQSLASKLLPKSLAEGFAGAALNAAAGSILGQGAAIVLGVQDRFDWRAVAGAAVGAGVSTALGAAMGTALDSKYFGDIGGRVAGGIASQAIANRGRVNFASVAADVFGNVLGNALASSIAEPRQQQVLQLASSTDSEARAARQAQALSLLDEMSPEALDRNAQQFSESYVDSWSASNRLASNGGMPLEGLVSRDGFAAAVSGYWSALRSRSAERIGAATDWLDQLVPGAARAVEILTEHAPSVRDAALSEMRDAAPEMAREAAFAALGALASVMTGGTSAAISITMAARRAERVRIPAMPVPESGGSRYLIPVSCRYNNPVDAGTSRAGGKAVSARWVASVKSREIALVKACGFSSSNRL
jgi:hypothetical protein